MHMRCDGTPCIPRQEAGSAWLAWPSPSRRPFALAPWPAAPPSLCPSPPSRSSSVLAWLSARPPWLGEHVPYPRLSPAGDDFRVRLGLSLWGGLVALIWYCFPFNPGADCFQHSTPLVGRLQNVKEITKLGQRMQSPPPADTSRCLSKAASNKAVEAPLLAARDGSRTPSRRNKRGWSVRKAPTKYPH